MFQRILVPTDGSRGARHAMNAAVSLARLSGGDLIAMHVVAPAVPEVTYMGFGVIGAPVPLDAVADRVPVDRDHALNEACRIGGDAGVAVRPRQVCAIQPALAILDLAQAEGCDLIVMASQGYGDLLSLITGSTTARVISGGDLPVLVVH